MGANLSPENNTQNDGPSLIPSLVPRDHKWDKKSGMDYLKAHNIPELFVELKNRLLLERPLHPYKFLRDILIHKAIEKRDNQQRQKKIYSLTDNINESKFKKFNFKDDLYDMDNTLVSRISYHRPRSKSDSNIIYSKIIQTESENQIKSENLSNTLKNEEKKIDINNNDNNNNNNNNEHFKKLEIFTKSMIQQAFKRKSTTLKNKFNKIKLNMNNINNNVGGNNMKHSGSDKVLMNKGLQPQKLNRTNSAGVLNKSNNPHHCINHQERSCFGFDIGGSLVKICIYEPYIYSKDITNPVKAKLDYILSDVTYGETGRRDKKLSFNWNNGKFHFITFQTSKMKDAVKLFKLKKLLKKNEPFFATGGGAHKYGSLITKELRVNLKKGDELKCLLYGLNFLLTHIKDEIYYLSNPMSKDYKKQEKIYWNIQQSGDVFPYMFVNIGSGVSILKIDNPKQFERVSGTMIGGGTYYGLMNLIYYYNKNKNNHINGNNSNNISFNNVSESALTGNSKKVNMLVSDIYGGDYKQGNLSGDIVASSFGKLMNKNNINKINICDISRALNDMISMNIAHLAYLNAIKFKINRIIFAGNFLRGNNISMSMISFAIHYWSKGVMKALFLKHEGYFGSIGVFLLPFNDFDKDNKDD